MQKVITAQDAARLEHFTNLRKAYVSVSPDIVQVFHGTQALDKLFLLGLVFF